MSVKDIYNRFNRRVYQWMSEDSTENDIADFLEAANNANIIVVNPHLETMRTCSNGHKIVKEHITYKATSMDVDKPSVQFNVVVAEKYLTPGDVRGVRLSGVVTGSIDVESLQQSYPSARVVLGNIKREPELSALLDEAREKNSVPYIGIEQFLGSQTLSKPSVSETYGPL